MKKIVNEKTNIKDKEKFLKYSDLIKIVCMNSEIEKGVQMQDMLNRQRILKAVEESGKEIQLEDSDYKNFLNLLKNMRWMFVHEEVAKFIQAVIDVK